MCKKLDSSHPTPTANKLSAGGPGHWNDVVFGRTQSAPTLGEGTQTGQTHRSAPTGMIYG